MNKIEPIKKRYYELAKQIGAPEKYIQFREHPLGDGSPHIEFSTLYYFVVSERGTEYERRPTNDPDEILYWLISDLTKQMAIEFELTHRIETEDCRRKIFSKHLDLLNSVNSTWADKKQDEYNRILKQYPYNDKKS